MKTFSRLIRDPLTGVAPICSQCRKVIPAEDVNAANDVAYCRSCNLAHALSRLVHSNDVDLKVDTTNPPPGAYYRNDGFEVVVGATHRSLVAAIGTLFFGLFWNGIVSVFVCVALASTLTQLHIGTPAWFPAPNMNGSPMGWGMTIFLWLFLTPFIAIGLSMIAAFLTALMGHTEVRIRSGEGTVFSGVGPIGLRRRFEPSMIKEVRFEDKPTPRSSHHTHIVLELAQGSPIRFGAALAHERRRFVAGAVRAALHL